MVNTTILAQQIVKEAKFTVGFTSAEGNDSTIEIIGRNTNSFSFIGGKGGVNNPITGIYSTEENQDLYVWIEELNTYSAAVKLGFSENVFGFSGYCLSKKPNAQVSDNVIEALQSSSLPPYYLYYENIVGARFDLHNRPLDEDVDYVLTSMDSPFFYASLEGLEYMTTYYVRPYVIHGGFIMYGGEKSFTTPRTIAGVLENETTIGEWYYYDAETGVVLTNKAMLQLIGYAEMPNKNLQAGIAQDLKNYLTEDKLIQLKAASNNNIECVDGRLYLVDDVSSGIISSFQEYYYSHFIAFSPLQYVNKDNDWIGNPLYTQNVGVTNLIECDESWSVPYNSCVEFVPTGSSVNPKIAINIPKYLFPRTYSIYAVFVHPEDDPRGYRFYTYMWEKQTDDEGNIVYPSLGTHLVPPEGAGLSEGNYYMTNPQNRVDTLFIGNYTFNGAPNSMIQFYTQITSRQTLEYNRTMRIAQIYLVPTEEEETEQ